jgi:hypothetical protein
MVKCIEACWLVPEKDHGSTALKVGYELVSRVFYQFFILLLFLLG